jgi:Xaa-Pro aminopeptidase
MCANPDIGMEGNAVSAHNTPRARVLYSDSERNADMLYATGIFVPDPFVFVLFRKKKYMAISSMEFSRAKKEAKVDHIYRFQELLEAEGGKHGVRHATPEAICVSLFKKLGIERIEVPTSFPLGLADRLRNGGIGVSAGKERFFPDRAIKDDVRVGLIRKSMEAAEYGMKVGVEALKQARVEKKSKELFWGQKRLTSERLRSSIQQAILDKQCVAMHTIVACGRQGYDPHQRGTGPLSSGQPIVIDIFPRSEISGYYGDMTRTFVKGTASDMVRKMFEAVREAQAGAISRIRPGIASREIHKGVVEFFQNRGFKTGETNGEKVGFIHGTGHGIGLEVHEYPWISDRSCRLKRGHVVTVEPGLYYPEIGGVRLEDVVWIGNEGSKNLTEFPKFLEIS